MDTKQKALLVLTVTAFGYLGYQVYGLMKSDMSNVPPVVRSTRSNGPVAIANATELRNPLSNMNLPASPVVQQAPALPNLYHAPLVTGQKAYLHMVNQYELAKMKRRLLEERAAIAAAQHRIATLNKQTREIDDSLAGAPQTYDDTENRHAAPFQLSYVDRQNGEWSATLNRSGRYYQVHPGSELSDGSKILSINRQSVTLKKGNKEERITFDGIVELPVEKTPPKRVVPVSDLKSKARHALANADISSNKPVIPRSSRGAQGHNDIVKAEENILVKKKKRDIVLASLAKKTVEHKSHNKIPAKKPVIQAKPTVQKSKPASRHYTEDERRILVMPKKAYSIQLIGSYHRDIVENFAIANDLGNRAMQFYVMNRGKPWYVLLYGSYPTRKAAQAALRHLPPDLTPEDPWVRAIASVQQDIRHHRHRNLRRA